MLYVIPVLGTGAPSKPAPGLQLFAELTKRFLNQHSIRE